MVTASRLDLDSIERLMPARRPSSPLYSFGPQDRSVSPLTATVAAAAAFVTATPKAVPPIGLPSNGKRRSSLPLVSLSVCLSLSLSLIPTRARLPKCGSSYPDVPDERKMNGNFIKGECIFIHPFNTGLPA